MVSPKQPKITATWGQYGRLHIQGLQPLGTAVSTAKASDLSRLIIRCIYKSTAVDTKNIDAVSKLKTQHANHQHLNPDVHRLEDSGVGDVKDLRIRDDNLKNTNGKDLTPEQNQQLRTHLSDIIKAAITSSTPTDELGRLKESVTQDQKQHMLKKLIEHYGYQTADDSSSAASESDSDDLSAASTTKTNDLTDHVYGELTDILTTAISSKDTDAIAAFFDSSMAGPFVKKLNSEDAKSITRKMCRSLSHDSHIDGFEYFFNALNKYQNTLISPCLESFINKQIKLKNTIDFSDKITFFKSQAMEVFFNSYCDSNDLMPANLTPFKTGIESSEQLNTTLHLSNRLKRLMTESIQAADLTSLHDALDVEDALIPLLALMKKTVDVDEKQNLQEQIQTTIDSLNTSGKLANHSHGAKLFKERTQQHLTGLSSTLTTLMDNRNHNKEQLQQLIDQRNPDVLKSLPLGWKEDDSNLTQFVNVSNISELKDEALTAILQNPTVGACLVTESEPQFHEFIDNISQKDLVNLAMAFKQLNNTLSEYENGNTLAIPSGHIKDNPAELRTPMAKHLLTYCSKENTTFKDWPIDAVRQAYALLAPAIGKSTTLKGLTDPLTTADRVTVDSELRKPIETVDEKSLKKLGIKGPHDQSIILKSTETKNGFLALQKRLEADCPGSHCVYVPEKLTQPSDSTDDGNGEKQPFPNAFVRSGRTTTQTAINDLLTESAREMHQQINANNRSFFATPTTDNEMHTKNRALMGTGFCWKNTNQTYTLHFRAHICTGMDDTLFKRSNEKPWLKDMHQSVAELTKKAPKQPLSVTINNISFTIDPPMVTEHPQSKIGLSDIGSSRLGVPSMFASAQNKAKKDLLQKIDKIVEQQSALGEEKRRFIDILKLINTKIEICNTKENSTSISDLLKEIKTALSKPQLTNHEKMFLRSIMHLYEKPQPPRTPKLNQVSTEGSGTFYQPFTIETLDLAFSALANCTPCYQCKSGQDRTKTMSIFHEMANDPTYLQILANGFNTNEERTQFGLRFFELATQNLSIAEQARPEGIGSGNKAIIKWNLNHVLDDQPIPKQMLDWACLPNVGNTTIKTLQSNLSKKEIELMQLGATQLIKKLKRNSKKTSP